MKLLKSVPSLILVAAILLAANPAASVSADVAANATITVNSNADVVANNGVCTLREAIINANNNNQSGSTDCAAGSGADTISFAANYTITLGSQLPAVTSPIVINGNGAGNTIIQASTCNPVILPGGCTPATYRVFQVSNTGNLTLNSLTVRHGRCAGGCAGVLFAGGGIYNDGSLTVTNSVLSGNNALDYGGGIFNAGVLTVTGSTFSGNSTVNDGGGILNSFGGNLTVTNSTFSGNSAFQGGGILNDGGVLAVTNSTLSGNNANYGGGIYNYNSLIVTNSTFSGNSASDYGGGIYNDDSLTVTNSTLSGNSASDGGGIINYGTLNFANTIIANSVNGGDCVNSDTLGANTNNLVEDGSCFAAFSGDPNLGLLANNGGSTQTHALLAGSPAIDAGDDAICAAAPGNNTSQNGVTRPQGSACDIGAYELVSITKTVFKSVAAQDGWILESSETSNVGNTFNNTATTLRIGDDASKKQYVTILSFNTGAALPDNAVITKVTLRLRQQGILGGGNPVNMLQGFMFDIRRGTFGTAALVNTDFQAAAQKTIGPVIKNANTNGWYVLNLTTGKNFINKLDTNNGKTQIRLRFKLDDNNNATANILQLFSGNATAANRPQLIVEYTVP